MLSSCRWLPLGLVLIIALAMPARAFDSAPVAASITLTPDEAEAIKRGLIQGKPNVATATIMSFLAPGSAQAYMGHADHTLYLWGGYLFAAGIAKVAIPPDAVPTGSNAKTADLVVGGLIVSMAAASAWDAYRLSVEQRDAYDHWIDHLTDQQSLPAAP